MTALVITHWALRVPQQAPNTDAERHELFARYARLNAADVMPWLFPLLDACGATVMTGQHIFSYALPNAPSVWREVPEMMRLLQMVPWVTEQEVTQ